MSAVSDETPVHGRVLVVWVCGERVALPVGAVREAIDAPVVRSVPLAPAGMLGYITLREQYVPVLDAAVLLGIPGAARAPGVVLVAGDGTFGIRVDEADDIWESNAAAVRGVPAGTDRHGVLQAVLHRDEIVASFVDVPALLQVAVAILRERPA